MVEPAQVIEKRPRSTEEGSFGWGAPMRYRINPYSPYQEGGVEQVNGLIRQFFPKKTDFRNVTHEVIQEVEDLLNNRPRKKLNYQTPNEVMRSGALNS